VTNTGKSLAWANDGLEKILTDITKNKTTARATIIILVRNREGLEEPFAMI
jgi:hypothetical protein